MCRNWTPSLANHIRSCATIFVPVLQDVNDHRTEPREREGRHSGTIAFGPVALSDSEGYLVANSLNQFALKQLDAVGLQPRRVLSISISRTQTPDKKANWLPALYRPFNLIMVAALNWQRQQYCCSG